MVCLPYREKVCSLSSRPIFQIMKNYVVYLPHRETVCGLSIVQVYVPDGEKLCDLSSTSRKSMWSIVQVYLLDGAKLCGLSSRFIFQFVKNYLYAVYLPGRESGFSFGSRKTMRETRVQNVKHACKTQPTFMNWFQNAGILARFCPN